MHRHYGWLAGLAMAMTLIVEPPAAAQGSDAKALEVLAAARKALGGEQKLSALKALSLRGTYRREMGAPAPGGGGQMMIMTGPGGGGAPQMGGEVEIDAVFPDKFIKVDTQTGFATITRTEGFDGDRPLLAVHSNSPHVRIMADNPSADPERAKTAVERARGELARLLLGMLAGTQPGFPVTYSYVGPAESPDGKAEAIDVKGPAGFAARLFIDAESHLPLMLTYMAPEPRVMTRMAGPGPARGGAGAPRDGARVRPFAELPAEERERIEKERQAIEAQPAKLIEYRLFFSDYREVGGLSLPHRIVRGTASATTEEWEIKSYKVNPSIKADRFTVS
jgi:hypothetical protein